MAATNPGGPRGRRKQAKPQRKVELNELNNESIDQTRLSDETPPQSLASMSPDSNHNEILEKVDEDSNRHLEDCCKEAVVPEELLNGLTMHSPEKVLATGGSAADVANDLISAKAATGDDDEKIKEYLQRSDTAVIYPEPVGRQENVSPHANGDELNTANSEYFIKCPQCQKSCQTFQALKDHMETSHSDLMTTPTTPATPENGQPTIGGATDTMSPTPSVGGTGGPFGCGQCTVSFTSKDQLDKHELLHSPNAQVSCKICNKTFANVYRLQRHMISHDESAVLRKFKCTECEKAFKFKHHLKEHIRIHSGEKPFKCPNCGKRFSHSGSYSSHMTSKKCLVMNLKLGRTRTNTATLLDKSPQANGGGRPIKRSNPINNNVTTSPNHNTSYLPILPKYTEAAAAFLQNSLAANACLPPFYLTPSGTLNAGPPLPPYPMPNLGHIFERLQRPPMPPQPDGPTIKCEEMDDPPPPSNRSSSGSEHLVMDEERARSPSPKTETSGGDLEAVKRILETVNATVTKQLLQANIQKFSSESSSSDCPSISSLQSPKQEPSYTCGACKKCFDGATQLEEHECEAQDMRSEGLAAKLEDALTTKCEEHSGAEEMGDKPEDDMDCESVTTTDHVSEDGRKVRVRSLISDEQLKVLKDNYKVNPRPKREELEKIAEAIGFPVRVVQVWFQNTRARDRREGRLVQVPYAPLPNLTLRYPLLGATNHCVEQPLDLSTKRSAPSSDSSPNSSPKRFGSPAHHDTADDAMNLSRKSSLSPQPHFYQHSAVDQGRTPSPTDLAGGGGSSRLAQILAQPTHKLALGGMGLMPMDQLMQLGAGDLPSLSQLISNRISSLSPNGRKSAWNNSGSVGGDTGTETVQDDDSTSSLGKRSKGSSQSSQYAMKGLGSPVMGANETEMEGQFTCDQCDKSFSKQSSLARHKYEHSGQRPHKCNECPKAFKHKHHLTEHKRLHSGEKPFQCIKCLKRFSHSGSYSQHMNHRYSYCKPYRE